MIKAPRQMWLASLGAAAVTRHWTQSEAGLVFKTLVKEGANVETRAIRLVNAQIETTMSRANKAWKQTRTTVGSTVKQAADTAVDIVNNAMPKALPKIKLPVAPKTKAPVAKAKRAVKTVAKKAKRTAKRATKRS
jgi:hypothetical protein